MLFKVLFHPENVCIIRVIHQISGGLKRLDSPVICKIRHNLGLLWECWTRGSLLVLYYCTHKKILCVKNMDGKILECYHHYSDIHGLAKMIEQYFHNELPFCHDTLQRLLYRADSSIVGLVFSDSMHRLTGPTTITLMVVASVYLWPDH